MHKDLVTRIQHHFCLFYLQEATSLALNPSDRYIKQRAACGVIYGRASMEVCTTTHLLTSQCKTSWNVLIQTGGISRDAQSTTMLSSGLNVHRLSCLLRRVTGPAALFRTSIMLKICIK